MWGWVGHKHIFINGDGVVGLASSVPSIYGLHKTLNEGLHNQPAFHGIHGCFVNNHFILHLFL